LADNPANALKLLELKATGGNRETLKKNIERLKLSTDHWLGRSWCKGKTALQDDRIGNLRPQEIFCENSLASNSYIRTLVLKNNLKEYKCEKCKIDKWNNEPINLQLDHVNGKRKDNRLVNLRWLCPNCHSQTPTYCAKNVKAKRYSDELILELCKKHTNVRGVVEELGCNPRLYGRIRKIAEKNNVIFENKYGQGKKKSCKIQNGTPAQKSEEWKAKVGEACRRVNRPNKEELELLLDTMSLETIGRKYKLSSNAIRKWCHSYDILFGCRRKREHEQHKL
jgi:hypothetical protein